MVQTPFTSLVAAFTFIGFVSAQTSLFIPGFDPQPISAKELGAGSDGRTTWELIPGVTSGTFDDYGFAGTATLIAGPSDVQVVLSDSADGIYLSESCAISNGIANCNVAGGQIGDISTFMATMPVSAFEIQGGGLQTGAASGTSNLAPSNTPSSGSTASGGPVMTSASLRSSGAASPSQTQSAPTTSSQHNGSLKATVSAFVASMLVGVSLFILA